MERARYRAVAKRLRSKVATRDIEIGFLRDDLAAAPDVIGGEKIPVTDPVSSPEMSPKSGSRSPPSEPDPHDRSQHTLEPASVPVSPQSLHTSFPSRSQPTKVTLAALLFCCDVCFFDGGLVWQLQEVSRANENLEHIKDFLWILDSEGNPEEAVKTLVRLLRKLEDLHWYLQQHTDFLTEITDYCRQYPDSHLQWEREQRKTRGRVQITAIVRTRKFLHTQLERIGKGKGRV